MDYVATQILDDMFKQQYNQYHDQFGKNYHVRSNNKNTKLNTSEAKKIFFEWYKKGRTYNFFFEPSNNDAGKFIVQYVMFIQILLELLVNFDIKHREKLAYIFKNCFSL